MPKVKYSLDKGETWFELFEGNIRDCMDFVYKQIGKDVFKDWVYKGNTSNGKTGHNTVTLERDGFGEHQTTIYDLIEDKGQDNVQ